MELWWNRAAPVAGPMTAPHRGSTAGRAAACRLAAFFLLFPTAKGWRRGW